MVYLPGTRDPAAPFQVDVEVRDSRGRPEPASVTVVGQTAPAADGLV